MEAQTRSADRWRLRTIAMAACLAGSSIAVFGQSPAIAQSAPDQAPHAWRRADAPGNPNGRAAAGENPALQIDGNTQPAPAENADAAPQDAQPQSGPPAEAEPVPAQDPRAQGGAAGQQPQAPQNSYPPQQQPYPATAYPPNSGDYSIPATLTVSPGTYITVRVNGWLSSDKNQPGDAFTATLAEPVIVNAVVVARRGQTVGGVITEAKKAGHVEGTSRLGLKLTDMTTVDGQKVNLQTSMMARAGNTSAGRDAAAIGGTTAVGAAIGAAAGWGRGAAIGAGAGAAAGILGVLLTRGQPTIIYPETALTFRVEAPVTIDSTRAPQAFRYADQSDYGAPAYSGPPPARMAGPCYGCAPAAYPPAPYYAPAYYPYYNSWPYYWGSGFSFYVGPRFYYGPRHYAGGIWIRRR